MVAVCWAKVPGWVKPRACQAARRMRGRGERVWGRMSSEMVGGGAGGDEVSLEAGLEGWVSWR